MAMSNRLIVSATVVAVVAVVIAGLILVGSPTEARLRRFDERRLQDLQQISAAVDAYLVRRDRLPDSLQELAGESGSGPAVLWKDPASGQPYTYRKIDAARYELCATFARRSEEELDGRPRWPGDLSWAHGAGRRCFPRESRSPQR